MKVLGINHSNDSAASLIIDGEVIAASREERFTRRKHETSFPHRAIDFCLDAGGIAMEDLDAVAFFWNPGIHLQAYNGRQSDRWRHHLEFLYSVPNHLLRKMDGTKVAHLEQILTLENGKRLHIHFVNHHLCHAAGALFRSSFEEAALLTVDGYGERTSTHIARGKGLQIETLQEVEFPHSVGSLYAAFTQYLGFRANNGEGKVMGLASYGTPKYVETVRELVTLTEDGFELDLRYFSYYVERERRYTSRLIELLGEERKAEGPLTQRHYDIAYALQTVTEEILLHLCDITHRLTGESALAMAGGVVLNCVANGRIAKESPFEKTFFLPSAGDDGTAMGAALYVTHCVHGRDRRWDIPTTDYLGLSFSEEEMEQELRKAGVAYKRSENPSAEAAQALADGRIIGWFQGAAELGPRALGNRSILADPRKAEMKDILNARVKFREGFRPFAPSCLEESVGELFDSDHPSPYMLRVYNTLPERLQDLASVTHVDGGARVQTVTASSNPAYYALISEFGELTGVPCVLNTSFNIRGEPIVNSVADALKCFFTTDLDVLFIGPYRLDKPLH